MKGSVKSRKLKDGSVVYDIIVDLPPKPDGSRNQLKKRGFIKKKEAQDYIADIITKANNGYSFQGDKLQLKEYLEHWLGSETSSLSPSTQKRYKEFRNHINYHLGQVPISKLSGLQVKNFYKTLEEPQEYSNFKKGLSKSTILKIHRMLHKALTDAVRDGIIDKTCITNIKYGGVDHPEMDTWDSIILYSFLDKIQDEVIYLPVLLAYETGLRQSEITGLKWSDIDMDKGLLTVKRNYSFDYSENALADKKTKTKSSLRTITLFDSTLDSLKKQKQKQRLDKLAFGEGYIDDSYVCTNSVGKPINPHYISKRFAVLVKRLNFKRIRFHDLRHYVESIIMGSEYKFPHILSCF